MSEIRPMVEVIEHDSDDWRVYFNSDPIERCVCDGDGRGCGDFVYHFGDRACAWGFAREMLKPDVHKRVIGHWEGRCDCGFYFSDSCENERLMALYGQCV